MVKSLQLHLLLAMTVCILMGGLPLSAQTIQPTFPGADWVTKTPAEVSMDAAKLTTFSNYLGGRGCVVRHGYMVHTWGNQSQRADIASACKPFFTHFLFKALEDGRIPSLDQTVNTWEPRLDNINASLGYKDRNITWRHFANQISCYGVRENPGTAYDYNDYQMALFFDTLFLKVYGATYSNVDTNILRPMLTDVMQCQDNPTFMIFGTGDRPGRTGVSVRDHARLGLLYLNNGNWNGTQLISESSAKEAVRSSVSNTIPRTAGVAAEMIAGLRSIGSTTIPDNQSEHLGSYSWLWWNNGVDIAGSRHWPDIPMDTYGAFGHTNGKRSMVVIPSLDIVVAWNDTTLDQKTGNPQNEALKLLVAAVNSGIQPMKEQNVVDSNHPQWFKREKTGPLFMCGPGDPEDFLYRGARNANGTRNGDQMSLINKIKDTGANCIYMQVIRSHGGDGDSTHNPFINSDPAQRLDQDILTQWDDWFSEMDKNNITIFLILYDDGSRIWSTGDTVDSAERSFIQGIVNRFEHHRNLVWCVAEEYAERYSAARVSNIAAEIKASDMHKHPIGVHKNTGLSFTEFANDTNIDQFAIQYNVTTAAELHSGMTQAWADANGRYNLNMSECASHGTGITTRKNNWAIAMGGAYAMVLGMDIANTPVSDLQDCGRLASFFESTNFNEMSPRDDLAYGGTQYVLAKPGSSYIAYASNLSGDIGIKNMTAGVYTFKWLDCANGTIVAQSNVDVEAGDRTWTKPSQIGNELVVYINSTGIVTDGSDDEGIKVISIGSPGVNPDAYVTVTGAAGREAGKRVIYKK